jgi:putative PIN family toxin of toxin-antitoxin system
VRVLLDTNVLIAAIVSRGVCHEVVEHCERAHHLVSSDFILREFEAKLLGKFRVVPAKAAEAVELIRSISELVEPLALEEPACRDPDDDWVLATAHTGRCDCIVTGDKDLLVLGRFADIPILPPGSFWRFEATGSVSL